jgi:hypothetical protein
VPLIARRLGALAVALFLSLGSAAEADAVRFFQSPSANIGCGIDRQRVRCDIRERDWRPPPKPSSCPVDWGQGLTLGPRGRARFVCAGDTMLGAGRRLRYGRSIRRGRFRCTSRRTGMRCVNRRNGHGFHLSRERARRF